MLCRERGPTRFRKSFRERRPVRWEGGAWRREGREGAREGGEGREGGDAAREGGDAAREGGEGLTMGGVREGREGVIEGVVGLSEGVDGLSEGVREGVEGLREEGVMNGSFWGRERGKGGSEVLTGGEEKDVDEADTGFANTETLAIMETEYAVGNEAFEAETGAVAVALENIEGTDEDLTDNVEKASGIVNQKKKICKHCGVQVSAIWSTLLAPLLQSSIFFYLS